MKPSRLKVMHGDFPKKFTARIAEEIKHYSVPLLLNSRFIGSGTLIKCDKKHYVLTAHHVIKNAEWRINFEFGSEDKLSLAIASFPHSFALSADHLNLIELGIPKSDPQLGPDIAAIYLPEQMIGDVKSRKSFFDISHNFTAKKQITLGDGAIWYVAGFPGERRDGAIINGFAGRTRIEKRFEKDGFDYLHLVAEYTETCQTFDSFAGVSGGGIWRYPVAFDAKRAAVLDLGNLTFGGVAYFQTAVEGKMRNLVCHGPKTIYNKLRKALANI